MSEQKTVQSFDCAVGYHEKCEQCPCRCHIVSPGDLSALRARIEQLRERNANDKAAYDWRGGYDDALCDVLALLGAAQEKP